MKRLIKSSTGGFSLVEMMIGMTITLLIIGAFIQLFTSQNKSYISTSLRQEMSLNGRIALDEVQREAMNAGTGLPGMFASVQVFDGGADQPEDREAQGRFAAAALTHQPHHFSGGKVEAGPVDGLYGSIEGGIMY